MLRNDLLKGDIIQGTMISEFAEPNLLRIFKLAGYKYVIVDGEHGPFTSSQLAAIISLGRCLEFPVIVRCPGIDRGFITRTLDMGAEGLLIPMVNTKEEAELIIQFAKYNPLGKRGLSLTRSHTDYHPPKLDAYMAEANSRTIILTQIETKKAVNNAEDIASVEGIDALIVGPSDLSSDLGKPGDLKNPELLKDAEIVTTAALNQGKHAGTVSGNLEYIKNCKNMGMNFFCMSSELGMLLSQAKKNVREFQDTIAKH